MNVNSLVKSSVWSLLHFTLVLSREGLLMVGEVGGSGGEKLTCFWYELSVSLGGFRQCIRAKRTTKGKQKKQNQLSSSLDIHERTYGQEGCNEKQVKVRGEMGQRWVLIRIISNTGVRKPAWDWIG